MTKNNKNIIKIEPNPNKRSSVKVQQKVINIAGGAPSYTFGADGKKKVNTKYKEPENLNRLPGTNVTYAASLTKRGLKTGLDILVKNPYQDLDYYRDGWERTLKGKKRVRLQEVLEYKHDREKGYYSNKVTGIKPSESDDLTFYERPESKISLADGVTILDLNNPIHEVNYYMLRAHNKVANSYKELGNNHTHYIVDEQDKKERANKNVRRSNKVGAILEELIDLTDGTIINLCKALQIPKQGIDKQTAYAELDKYAKDSTEKFEEFISMYNMWKDPATRERFEAFVQIFNYLGVPGLLSRRGSKISWSKPFDSEKGGKREIFEWNHEEDFINNFLLDPSYREEVDIMEAQYKSKSEYRV